MLEYSMVFKIISLKQHSSSFDISSLSSGDFENDSDSESLHSNDLGYWVFDDDIWDKCTLEQLPEKKIPMSLDEFCFHRKNGTVLYA